MKQSITSHKAYEIIHKPLVTEKTMASSADSPKYAFRVDMNATKVEIKQAVEHIFNTKVDSVSSMIRKPKPKMFKGRKGSTKAYKIALVKLEKGKTIDLFGDA